MSNEESKPKRLDLTADIPSGPGEPDTYAELQRAAKPASFLGRVNAAFHEALQNSRGGEDRHRGADLSENRATADDLAIRRAKNVSPQRMVVPEGVIIAGSMSSGSETEIAGRVEGDVIVEGRLFLGPTALITGSVRATSCKVEGLVEGKMECSQELELGRTGRLNADAVASKGATLAGQVFGNVTTGGMLRLASTGRVDGNIHTRRLVIEEGAVFNGMCAMRTPVQRSQK